MGDADTPVVLIGPMADDPAESVSAVNRALIAGLNENYRFIPSRTNRRFGSTAQSKLNTWNLFYLAKHGLTWIFNLVWHRPQVAHYAINAGSALWKGLLFLRIARWFGAKTVGHLHSGGFIAFWQKLPAKKRHVALAQFERLDAFVVLSESWRQSVRQAVGVSDAKLHVVNNPIDAEFEAAALKMPLDRLASEVISMGVMARDKGVLNLVSAAGMLKSRGHEPRIHLVGPEREPGILDQVHDAAKREGLLDSIRTPGLVRGRAKTDLFAQTSISVLASYYENFPLVLLEAAAAGHAIITTPVGAVPEFFTDGESAIFVEPGNVKQLAEAMDRLVSHPDERRRLALGAREMFTRNLSRAAILGSLHDLYMRLLGRDKTIEVRA